MENRKIDSLIETVENKDEDERIWDGYMVEERKTNNELILKNIQSGVSKHGLMNLCKSFGKLTDFRRPEGSRIAFATFATQADAENALRMLREEKLFRFEVEFAIKRNAKYPKLENRVDRLEDFKLKTSNIDSGPNIDNGGRPFPPSLRMDDRILKGPFGYPANIEAIPLISEADYKELGLLKADPSKEYLWNTHDEADIESDRIIHLQIVHGRRVHKNAKYEINVGSQTLQEPYVFTSNKCEPIKMRKCSVCTLEADKYHEKSDKIFCSLKCLNNDENLENLNVKIQNIIEVAPMELKQIVKITHVINHRLLFVRPGTVTDDIAFTKFINEIIRSAKVSPNYKSLPEIGELVLAHFSDFYQRALVLKHLPNEKVVVAFIDFGNIEVVNFNELKKMSDKLKQIKRFATKIMLKNVDDGFMDEQAIEYLYTLMAFDIELSINKIVGDNGDLMAELKSADSWVSDQVNMRNTKLIHSQYESNKELFIELKCISGNDVPVLITDNSLSELSMISFIHIDDLGKFHKNERRIQAVCQFLFTNEEPHTCYTPKSNGYCLVRFNKRWYRGECIEIRYDGFATVTFIDYGNTQLIDIYDIRRMPQVLCFDCITATAIISEDPSMDDKSLGISMANGAALKLKCSTNSQQVFEYLKVDEKCQELFGKFK